MISINGVFVTPTVFPDKTSQVWKLPSELLDLVYKENSAIVLWDFESEAELIHVAQVKTLLDTLTDNVILSMPYLPYGRQDKRISNESTFALRSFAGLINAMKFSRVSVLDAHNHDRARMIDNLEDRSARKSIEDALDALGPFGVDTILFPDSGALVRYRNGINMPVRCADKIRDQETGNILGIKIIGSVKGKKLLIVDDICDGGATFIALAAAAKEAKSISLYVTHGIFSRGTKVLFDAGINRIFTYKGEIK